MLTIINKEDYGAFESEDREILEMLMNFVAVAINNSIELFRSGIKLGHKDFCRRVKATIDEFRIWCPEETLNDFTILLVRIEK